MESLPFGGQIFQVTETVKAESERGSSYLLRCKNCGKTLSLGERFFNRRGKRQWRVSRIYCMVCAEKLGFVTR
jgi:predicted SprT family Zn-dependent metalloprotease